MKHIVLAILLAFGAQSAAAQSQPTPPFWEAEWPNTDFSKSSVSYVEILSGGPPKDGIPALDGAEFYGVGEDQLIADVEPIVTVELEGETPRAYPIRYLMWHEIVNDRIGDLPVTVTFCPLCNSALVFDGRLNGQELTFGVSGKLRNSDMVMYDRQTESWWQQFSGDAIVGDLLGAELTQLPGWMESFAEFKARNPEGLVMKEPDARRRYGENPYAGYDSLKKPFLYNGENPPHGIAPLARVLRVGDRAWPLERIRSEGEIIEEGLRIVWSDSGQVSALDKGRISASKSVGTVRVFDANTGKPAVHEVVFAFAFHAFTPDGVWNVGG